MLLTPLIQNLLVILVSVHKLSLTYQMNVEEVLEMADRFLSKATGKPLTDVQRLILQGHMQGKTYEEVANDSGYQLNYIKQDAGPKLWKLLSDHVPGDKKIRKTDSQADIETFLQEALANLEEPPTKEEKPMYHKPDAICNRNVFILIDQSGSMTKRDGEGRMRRWDSLKEQVMSHVDNILDYEVNGTKICSSIRISLFSRNKVKDGKLTVKDVNRVEDIFLENRPDSMTFITPTLKYCIDEWFDSRNDSKTQGAFFIIYTDGQFDDTDAFEKLIKETCTKLENSSTIKILIIGVGQEIDNEYFEMLDTNAKKNLDMHKELCDIIVFDFAEKIEDIISLMEKEL